MDFNNYTIPYKIDPAYAKKVAYFSMEFAIEQSLKVYSGGLGFLSGSHLRSAYELKQNLIGIGILWKYGYYDQSRNADQTMLVQWNEKIYNFLEDTGIKFQINVHNHPVWVKAYYLKPEVFNSAPLFLLSTDLPENDYVSQTITHKLYDANVATKIAQFMVLGIGGATLIDKLNFNPEVYHLNEAHGVSSVFYLYNKLGTKDAVKKQLVFTTHTPEEAGNEKHDIHLLDTMGYFDGIPLDKVRELTEIDGEMFDHTLCALRFARIANGVSKLHGEVARRMWYKYKDVCAIISITNAQNRLYWADRRLYEALDDNDDEMLRFRKQRMKKAALQWVADQTGKILDEDVLTIVWARRFAGYKRPELITEDRERFDALMKNKLMPVQMVWAGKPYPADIAGVTVFNNLVNLSKSYANMGVCVGYELAPSRTLKHAADVWLNNPRVPREASGTSGMSGGMNAAVNFSTYDGWICEFIKPNENGYLIPPTDYSKMTEHEQDQYDLNHLYDVLENVIIPTYYQNKDKWWQITKNSMHDVRYAFDSNRMVKQYYEELYIPTEITHA